MEDIKRKGCLGFHRHPFIELFELLLLQCGIFSHNFGKEPLKPSKYVLTLGF
jgi:hypothetical protein